MNIFKDQEEDVIKTDVLKVRDNTLVFYNCIYQISNISEIRSIDLSTEKKMPPFYWIILIVGIALLALGYSETIIAGLLTLTIFGGLAWHHFKTKVNEKYGIYISLNSGRYKIIVAKNKEFVKRVVLTLHNIMNNKGASVNFDFSTNSINSVGAGDGSVVVTGNVSGDVANNIS